MGSKIVFVSSSIANWEKKILDKYQSRKYNQETDRNEPVIFFGMYSFNDYKRVWKHKGSKTVIWCGADILYLSQKRNWWRRLWLNLMRGVNHICENEVQQKMLGRCGVGAKIKYNFFGKVEDFPVSFRPSVNPHVFLHCPKGREEEYGLKIIERIKSKVPEITFHIHSGETSEKEFNKEIRNYQAGIRLNQFDGFSEVLAKSILLGQYPISAIKYPRISWARNEDELVRLLKELKNKAKPNPSRNWWARELYD